MDTDQYLNVFGNGTVDGADMLLTSAMKHLDNAVFMTIEDFLAGVPFGGNVEYGLEDDGVGLAPFHQTDTLISSEIKTYIYTVAAEIIAGTRYIDDPCAASIWYTAWSGSPEENVLLSRIAQAEIDHPEWGRIIASYHPDSYEFIAAVQHGWGPDLYWGTSSNLPFYLDAGVLLDLSLYVDSTDLEHFLPYAIDGMTSNGSLYGIPQSSKAVALYYRKSTVPTPPTTTAELLSLVRSGKLLTAYATYHDDL